MNLLRQKLCLIFFFVAIIHSANAQTKWYNNFSLEIGGGYNTTKSKVDDHTFNLDTTYRRNAFSIQPTVRLSYTFALSKKDSTKFILSSFVGYYVFGGKSRTEADGYKDIYKFNSIEAGIIPAMRIGKGLFIGIGIKGQYILSVKAKYYGFFNDPDSIPRTWQTRDQSDIYYSYAFNAGLQAKYHIKKFSIAAEGWSGLSNLFSLKSDLVDVRVTENNYRILIGYNF